METKIMKPSSEPRPGGFPTERGAPDPAPAPQPQPEPEKKEKP